MVAEAALVDGVVVAEAALVDGVVVAETEETKADAIESPAV